MSAATFLRTFLVNRMAADTIASSLPDLATAHTPLRCGKRFTERQSSDDGSSAMTYTLTVYPNQCGDEAAYLGKHWGVHH
jgi:hypothetical protein